MILSRTKLKNVVTRLKNQDKTIVFTNGCFDILHAGHIKLLRKAKSLGDILVVAINSDSSVRRLKGHLRPLTVAKYRAKIVDSIKYVDFVCVFNEDTPEEIIGELKPDILVKGSDWKFNEVIGRDQVGKVVRVALISGISTSNLINQLRKL